MPSIDTTNPLIRERLHLASVRYYCGVYRAGMVSRQVPATRLRQLVESATGAKFKRGDWSGMYTAINALMRS